MAGEKRIMIVDDDDMSLRRAEFILKKTGHDIVTATSGEECMRLLQQEPVDLIFLDVKMPGKDGIETLREIRAMDGFSDLPVIFLTGSEDSGHEQEAKELGAKDFVLKPLKPQELIAQVEKTL